MSDDFDKEAEREKLREKFADDEQKREHTQRMSELLLKGATMTNRHCEECGDPIFRHDGREFCPTCGNEAGGAAGGNEATGTAAEPDAAGGTEATGAPPDVDAGAADGVAENGSVGADSGVTDSATTESGATESAGSRPSRSAAVQSQGSAPPQQSDSQRPEPRRPDSRPPESGRPTPPQLTDDAEGVGAARASLTRTLTRFARAAEETDDPRRARDHLEAAREAAEALAALD
ncbi:Sjogren's syndrome/scleroderma autoantigen 1 family protein [Halorubrum ezzemoulense]|uniref:Sjogren's syndrome/scleroderma autoantigen 1 family protein n=1 Tax=Halorubrum ezzemoulense TaxID=337243 RepID=UPI00232F1740|nr:Sjogren's syndrome/scleroderma autoantigen 1 family protein [Halorubrum ezzemoulense]MDB2260334.1 Sjogren's syndrome/scleroderma autoantigen 1 family protein [Halorubrum ezzemoulense]MDB2267273.1 Sjogren's syndrome/scleroderma autoantigen 1 family protein [Halorubrum ezzemoulense]